MRPALLLAAAFALGAAPAAPGAPAPTPDATTADIRCLFVSGALAQGSEPDLKEVGALSLFYFWGRLEGRGMPADLAQRVIGEVRKMTPDEVKAEAQRCADQSKSAAQSISDLNATLHQSLGRPAPPPGG
jgi:hypothetical protein